ncbi:MAG: hypothetical protein ACOY90_10245 [Candidatus Zhuqueibacterota bacterium]
MKRKQFEDNDAADRNEIFVLPGGVTLFSLPGKQEATFQRVVE